MASTRGVQACLIILFGGIVFVSLISRINFTADIHQSIPKPHNAHFKLDMAYRAALGPTMRKHKEVLMHPQNEKCRHRLPNAIIIGTAKSGTLALITFLSYHPQIAATLQPGEVNFFNKHYDKGLDWYRNRMNCSYTNQIAIEKTPAYFRCPNKCGLKIKAMDKNVKLIVIVKDPITRTQSHYAMRARFRERSKYPSFENMFMDSDTGKLKTESQLLKWSNYAYYLKKWLEIFSLNQIHFVDGLALENNPAVELKEVEDFLEIGNYFTKDHFVFNETKGKYCVQSQSGMECLKSCKGTAHPDIPPDMLIKLKSHFHPINEEFFKLIDRRFDWGY